MPLSISLHSLWEQQLHFLIHFPRGNCITKYETRVWYPSLAKFPFQVHVPSKVQYSHLHRRHHQYLIPLPSLLISSASSYLRIQRLHVASSYISNTNPIPTCTFIIGWSHFIRNINIMYVELNLFNFFCQITSGICHSLTATISTSSFTIVGGISPLHIFTSSPHKPDSPIFL